jgi:hypothetical protein
MARWFSGGTSFSHFIVAGSEFVDSSKVPSPIKINPGPGYDGQFFYRYGIQPFSFEKTAYGITLDHPAYRHQRITYPLLGWALSFGQASYLPFSLVLVNVLALAGLLVLLLRFCNHFGVPRIYCLFPLLFSGLWMSLGRDLAEPLECFFIAAGCYAFLKRKALYFTLFTLLSLFTREPSAIVLFPLACAWLYDMFSKAHYRLSWQLITNTLLFALPFLLLIGWKTGLQHWHVSETFIEGGNNIGIPFYGLYQGFWEGIHHLDSPEDYVEFTLWTAFACWNVWLVLLSSAALRFKPKEGFAFGLSLSWCAALLMASLYTYSIYVDDWAFLRVLSGFNLIALILLFSQQLTPPRSFTITSAILVFTTIGRLLLKV